MRRRRRSDSSPSSRRPSPWSCSCSWPLLATWTSALALRPLARIEGTAAAIAAGDLGRRIESVDRRTEVGRLGLALNTMLGRIEAALTAREASEQRLRRLVTDASHELRTPLTAIRGYAELFRRGADERPADLARAMRGIESESERMADLVDELLLLARARRGPGAAATEEDLVPVVRAAVDAARVIEPDRPLDVHLPRDRPRPRGRRADAPGRRQPADQRPRPHASWHAGHRDRSCRRQPGGPRSGRRRPRHERGRQDSRLRAVLPSRSIALAGQRRIRPRARDRRRRSLGLRRRGRRPLRARQGSTFTVYWPAAATPLDAAGL